MALEEYMNEFDLLEQIDSLRAELAKKDEEIANLKSVMIAACEEISAHWESHCDEEGYGPVNLMHRLERGIPSEYGYKAGDFERMRTELAAANAKVVMEFSEDEVPQFSQGYDPHEILEVVTAERCTWLVDKIIQLRAELVATQLANKRLVESLRKFGISVAQKSSDAVEVWYGEGNYPSDTALQKIVDSELDDYLANFLNNKEK